MVFGKHTPFLVLVWQMRPQVRCILFTLVYDIRANRLLTTSRLFTPVCCLHHDGQYDWFTPWWSIWLVGEHFTKWATCNIKNYYVCAGPCLNFELWNKGIHPWSQTKQGSNSQCSESSESQEVETSYTGQKIVVQEPENQFGSINKIHLTINVS